MNIDSLAIITSTIVTLTTIIIKYQSDKFYKQHDSLLKSIDSRIALLDDQIKELTKESKKYVETCGKYLSIVDQYTLNSVELADFEAAANDSYVNGDIELMVRGMRAKHKRQEFLDYGAQDYLYSYFKSSIDSINDKITKLSKEQSLLLEQQRNLYPSTLGNTLKQWLSEKLSRQQNNKK